MEDISVGSRSDPPAAVGSGSNQGDERSNQSDDLIGTGPFSIPPPITRTKNVRHKKTGTDEDVVYLGQATARMSITRRLTVLEDILERRHQQIISEVTALRTYMLRLFTSLIPEIPAPCHPPPLTTSSRVQRFLERVGVHCDCLNP